MPVFENWQIGVPAWKKAVLKREVIFSYKGEEP